MKFLEKFEKALFTTLHKVRGHSTRLTSHLSGCHALQGSKGARREPLASGFDSFKPSRARVLCAPLRHTQTLDQCPVSALAGSVRLARMAGSSAPIQQKRSAEPMHMANIQSSKPNSVSGLKGKS